jgi:hypothetical protein
MTWSSVVNEEHGKGVDTVISERLLEIFSNTIKWMGLSVSRLDSLVDEGEATLHAIEALKVGSVYVFGKKIRIIGVIMLRSR